MSVAVAGRSPTTFDIKSASVAVQGYGNVGSISAELIAELGARIVAITDWKQRFTSMHDCFTRELRVGARWPRALRARGEHE